MAQTVGSSGLDGLIDKPRSGRMPILDEHHHEKLQELVAEHPHQIRSVQTRLQEETGKLIYHTTPDTVTTETVIEAFDQLVAQKHPDTLAIVVLDNARMHRPKAFKRKILEWMAHRVHLVYLSAYWPELNLIETLWRRMKYAWLPLNAYRSFNRLRDEVHRLLGGYGTEYTINYE